MAKSYILPFLIYLLGVTIAAQFDQSYAFAYMAVVLVVGLATYLLLRGRQIVQPHGRVGGAVVVGLVGIALWIGLSQLQLESHIAQLLPEWLRPEPRVGLDPFVAFPQQPLMRTAFLILRITGLAILVPVAEELFWRGFLLRWLTSPEWEEVPPGKFSWQAFLVVVLMFTAAHPEWIAAAVYCMLLNGLYYWKKDLWHCIVAHGVSNLALAGYILATGAWWLW